MSLPKIALFIYQDIPLFHFSVPQTIFNIQIDGKKLFEVITFSADGLAVSTEKSVMIQVDGGLELMYDADIVIIPGWDDINQKPVECLINALKEIHQKGIKIAGLCYGAFPLAYAGLLDHKHVTTHWAGSSDFKQKFPCVNLDKDALYIEDSGIITSAGTGAALDCCLYIVGQMYGSKTANKISRIMVIPTHREGGQAQFIEQPISTLTYDTEINQLVDYLRKNLSKQHTIDELALSLNMSRRTLTRHFKQATGVPIVTWLNNERLRYASELLEATDYSIEKIMEASGFNTAVLFRKLFKKKYGTSPVHWRKSFSTQLSEHDE
ncbi:AraC family transcriptional regulator [Acinetobacter sp. ANC 5054]|uniref:GlxA family transcriptional regulator n=1 Tax=Acinetobacter sp. ANC 5054 TaxID=1977877 RepID=UPI000A335631|nr:helix-turn-helix domain-containing protein [Acinetobacter sp. ANC 5054]OTG79523.1 AraC family transcriptional regulator [Acinetobacter sp. ANC 5054]